MLPAASITAASSARMFASTATMRSPSTRTSPVTRLGTLASMVTMVPLLKRVRVGSDMVCSTWVGLIGHFGDDTIDSGSFLIKMEALKSFLLKVKGPNHGFRREIAFRPERFGGR